MENIIVDGHKIKGLVATSTFTKERVVADVQDLIKKEAATFSLSGLDCLFKGELPKKNTEIILTALAQVLGCDVSEFARFETMAS